MSADESALLAAVAADPGGDLPRLVYADWLDDHGQSLRAEFIRLQCEIARLEVGPRAVVYASWRLWKRQQDLLGDHLPEVLGPASELESFRPVCRRGFVDELTIPARSFPDAARLLVDLPVPPSRVAVTGAVEWHTGWLQDTPPAAFDRVTALDLALPHEDAADHSELDDGSAVRAVSGWPRLVALSLAGCDYGPAVIDWFPADAFPALRDLDLSGNDLSDAALIDLLNTGLFRRLAHLSLDGNRLTDQSAFELADRLAQVPAFRTLDFRRTHVTPAGQLALTTAFGSRCNLF